jgi:hypothetical protein
MTADDAARIAEMLYVVKSGTAPEAILPSSIYWRDRALLAEACADGMQGVARGFEQERDQWKRRAERWKEAARAYRSVQPWVRGVLRNRGSEPSWENIRWIMQRIRR